MFNYFPPFHTHSDRSTFPLYDGIHEVIEEATTAQWIRLQVAKRESRHARAGEDIRGVGWLQRDLDGLEFEKTLQRSRSFSATDFGYRKIPSTSAPTFFRLPA
jgi:hypothetical protein